MGRVKLEKIERRLHEKLNRWFFWFHRFYRFLPVLSVLIGFY
ncbi:hypothetical protein SLEP1_g20288 [Rubroshorea leprosula]|uniref:Uncharacterized protein n=1 Tax=Rubroshorea leprosula TaxID=152421 RepID=A0AAV5J9S2_9ROSI|nr:hypothetical protein SLEP1_g20288 [Rubroshorea leprosula]